MNQKAYIVGEYTLYKLLGKGSFGEVYLTSKKNSNEILATKKLDKKKTDSPSIKKYFDNEISIMKELNHPNVIKFHQIMATYSHYYVVMEYCNGGDLTGCLKKYKELYHRPFSEEIVQYLMKQIIEGIKYIHSLKIIHRDIKLDNILVSFPNEFDKNKVNMMNAKVKIIDFGLATKLGPENLTYTALGSPINMDPIILKKYNNAGGYEQLQGYNEKADIWSLGTVFYELLTGEALFKVKNMKDLVKKVEKGVYTIPTDMNLSKESIAFLNSMLQYDADKRLSAEELSQHYFLSRNISDFSHVDLDILSTKIDEKGLLNINVKQNQTIFDVFNKEDNPQDINPFAQKKQQKNYVKQNFINNDFYGNFNFEKGIQAVNNINKQGRITEGNNKIIQIPNRRRFSEGYISPRKNKLVRMATFTEKKIENNFQLNDKEELKKYINGLYNEYNSIKEYFKENNLLKQEEDAAQKCMQIQHTKLQFEQGYPIYSTYLPKPITLEYLYGQSTEERTKIFRKIITKFTIERNELESKIRNVILYLKELEPEKYAKLKNGIMPKLNNEKTKLDKLKKIVEAFKEKQKNIWIPAPDIDIKRENNQSEQFIPDKEYKIKIKIGKTDYMNENFHLNIILKLNDNKILNREIKLKSIGDFNEEWIWTLNQEEWNKIDNYHLKVEYFYGLKQERGAIKFHIGNIKNRNEIAFNCPLELYFEKITTRISININYLATENNNNSIEEVKEIINIKKIYPEFKGKSKDTEKIPNSIINI